MERGGRTKTALQTRDGTHTHKYSLFFLRLLRAVFYILFAVCKRFELLIKSLTACTLFEIATP